MQDGPWNAYQTATPTPSPTPAAGPWSAYGAPEQADQKSPPPAAAGPMTLTVTNRKGRKITFTAPVDADDALIRRLAASATGEPRYAKAVVQRMAPQLTDVVSGEPTKPEAVVAEPDDDSALSGFVAGALKPIDKAAEWITNTGVGKAIDNFGVSLGFPSATDTNAEHDEWRRNNTRTGWQLAGNVAGVLPLSTLGGGALLQGAMGGALLTDSHDLKGTAWDATLGAGGGYVGGKLLSGLGSLATGAKNQGARLLNEAGIPLTLGQLGRAGGNLPGRIVAGVEERLSGLPIVGDVVNAARDRGITGLNVALGNRILGNVGDKLPKGTVAGHDMVDAVQSSLSARYGKLVPNLRGVMDQDFAADLAAAKAATATLPPARQRQLATIVDDVFRNRTNGNLISGQALKDAESRLTFLFKKYASSSDADQTILAEAIDGVRTGLRNMVLRSNPSHADELRGLNTAWAQLKDLRSAIRSGSDATKATGIVTPGAALRTTARQGYRDPLLEAAVDALPNRTPDSGTAGRAALFLGAGAAGGAATVDPREHPYLAAALATTAALSTKTGQTALNKLAFGARPPAVKATGTALNKLGRYAPQLVTPALVAPQQ